MTGNAAVIQIEKEKKSQRLSFQFPFKVDCCKAHHASNLTLIRLIDRLSQG